MVTSNTSSQTQGSSSSRPTVLSLRSEPLLELGKRIVTELGIDESTDTLGRWMAHYIAELILAAESASVEEQPAKRAQCTTAILELWNHRHHLPAGKRPFEDFDAVLRALESLDPNASMPRYFPAMPDTHDNKNENAECKKWLSAADTFDRAARIIVRYCIARASESASDEAKSWLTLAEAAGLDRGPDVAIIQIITAECDMLKRRPDADELRRKEIQDRIKCLEAINEFAAAVAVELREQLYQADGPRPSETSST